MKKNFLFFSLIDSISPIIKLDRNKKWIIGKTKKIWEWRAASLGKNILRISVATTIIEFIKKYITIKKYFFSIFLLKYTNEEKNKVEKQSKCVV